MTFAQSEQLHRWVREEIRRITVMHPLLDLESNFLTYYARESVLSDRQKTDYRAIIDWLHSTSRISPRERDELKKLTDRIAAWQPEEEHAAVD